MRPPVASLRSDVGVASVELALLAVVFIMMFMLAAFAWRVTQTLGDVSDAAAEAARAASLDLGDDDTARAVANASLDDAGVACGGLSVDVAEETVGAAPEARTVSVRVACEVALGDLALIGLPGSKSMESTHTEVIDVYVGGSE